MDIKKQKTSKNFINLKPWKLKKGNEKLSQKIDEVLYGEKK